MAKNRWHGKYEKTFINQDEVIYLSLPLRHGDLREDGYSFIQYYYRTTIATGGCSICRYKKSLSALHFHHMNSKKLPLSKMHGYSRKSVKEEMRKCILVCANCHSEIHDKEREEV